MLPCHIDDQIKACVDQLMLYIPQKVHQNIANELLIIMHIIIYYLFDFQCCCVVKCQIRNLKTKKEIKLLSHV